jgi:hypothetical protein
MGTTTETTFMRILGLLVAPNAPEALGLTWPTWPSKLLFDATPTHKTISVQ